jgi:hypothetical protein
MAGLDEALLARLKHREQFQGARHELFAEATCYRAGFAVQHENERDGTRRHAEFSAKHTRTGQMLSVEAKSKHVPESLLWRVLLNHMKNSAYALVVF